MNQFRVEKYTKNAKNQWDDFVRNSKNGSFLFHRDFMEYHADRFEDFSLMVYEKNKLLAVFPANKKENIIFSHQGLTYGGVVLSKKIKFEKTIGIYKAILQFLDQQSVEKLQLKPVPKIYHTYPADEVDYLLFILQAKLIRADLSSTILNNNKLKIQSNRLEGLKKAEKHQLKIEKSKDFSGFWTTILIPNLQKQFEAKPVHSLSEITDLAKKFPNNIHQYNVLQQDQIVGGCTVFETETVAHIQYISADENRQHLGTLDFLFRFLIEETYASKAYFDFGTSNENQGLNLNQGLLYWKESFGARAIVYPAYEIQVPQHDLLDQVFS